MRPDERDLDEEIRGQAISVKERIDRGEDPEAARLAALREFGYVPAVRDSMRRVWYSAWFDAAEAPIPSARVTTTVAARPLARRSERTPTRLPPESRAMAGPDRATH